MEAARITAGARKHRVARARILAALANGRKVAQDGDLEMYLGTDDEGVELEIGLVPDDRNPGRMACIHAMPTHYRRKGK